MSLKRRRDLALLGRPGLLGARVEVAGLDPAGGAGEAAQRLRERAWPEATRPRGPTSEREAADRDQGENRTSDAVVNPASMLCVTRAAPTTLPVVGHRHRRCRAGPRRGCRCADRPARAPAVAVRCGISGASGVGQRAGRGRRSWSRPAGAHAGRRRSRARRDRGRQRVTTFASAWGRFTHPTGGAGRHDARPARRPRS